MTENAAIEYLKGLKEDYFQPKRISEALDTVVESLEEVQKYRALGKIEFLTDMKNHYVEVLSDLRQYQKLGTIEELKEDKVIADELSAIEAAQYYTAFSEWKKYREIGTVEECREAREKQRAKNPISLCLSGRTLPGCPMCKERIGIQQRYCEHCGKTINWS